MKYGLYVRKSSEDSGKQVQSIENQIEVLKALAEKNNLTIFKTYQESKSAKIPYKREQFQKMIIDLQEGIIDGIICWKLDRLSRNPIDGGTIHHYLLEGVIKEIVTHEKTYYPCDNSIMMSVELGMATEYSQALSKNTKRGQAFKVQRGSYPGQAPLGYMNTVDRIKGERDIVPDPDRFKLVRELWDLLLTGDYSVMKLVNHAKQIGLKIPATRSKTERYISKTGLYKLFQNPFYYGAFNWSGKIHEGNHEPLVSKEEFDLAQELISKRDRPKLYKHKFAFTRLIECGECGSVLHAEHKDKVRKDGSVNKRSYYRCTHRKIGVACTQKGIRAENLDEQMLDILESITVPHTFIDWAKKWLKDQTEENAIKDQLILKQQECSLNKLNKQIEKLVDMKLEDLIDIDTFKAKKESLIKEKRSVESSMKLNTESQDYKAEKIIEVFEFCKVVKEIFETGSIDDKNLVLKALGAKFSMKDQVLSVELSKPFQLIQEGRISQMVLNPKYATLNTRSSSENSPEEQALIKNGGGGGELPPSSEKALLGSTTSLVTGSELLPCSRSETINGFLSLNLYLLAKLNKILEDALTK